MFEVSETINTLKTIFEKHSQERSCVIGTVCVGKTTLLNQLTEYGCEDLDLVLWSNIPEEETVFLNRTSWSQEFSDEIDRLVYKYVRVKKGHPLFTTVIVDCEAVVYLDISDDLLAEHCHNRNVDFSDAKKIKEAIENDWMNHKAKKDKTLYYLVVTE